MSITVTITDEDEAWVASCIGEWRQSLEASLRDGYPSAAKDMRVRLIGAEMAFSLLGLADFARLARAAHNDLLATETGAPK